MRAWILSLTLLVSSAAWADWQVKSVPGTPFAVEAWSRTEFGVATSNGLSLFSNGTTTVGLGGAFMGLGRTAQGCVFGVRGDSTVVSVGACSSLEGTHLYPTSLPYMMRAVRFTPDGSVGFAIANTSPLEFDYRSSLVPSTDSSCQWGPLLLAPIAPYTGLDFAAVLAHGGTTHALFSEIPNASFRWFRGTAMTPLPAPSSNPPKKANALALFSGEDASNPTALFGNDNGLYRGTLGTGDYPFVPVALPGGAMTVLGMDVNTGAGSGRGDGFGVVVGTRNAQTQVLSAVPALTPSEIATAWRVNPRFSQLPVAAQSLAVRQVRCVGSELCVIILAKPDLDNVLIYTNTYAPELMPLPPSRVQVGEGTTVSVPVAPFDADGDAVRLAVTPGPSSASLAVQQRALDGGTEGVMLDLTAAPGLCGSETSSVSITMTDGLKAHEQLRTVSVDVVHDVKPKTPRVDVPDGGSYLAGEGPVRIVPSPSGGPCAIQGYVWTESGSPSGTATLAVDSAGAATFTPDARLCQPSNIFHNYEVLARDVGGLDSAPATVKVKVRPWGRPLAPFNAPTVLTVSSGTRVAAAALHACAGTPGLPTVYTAWSLQGLSAPPSGLSLVTDEQLPIEGPPVLSQGIVPTLTSCAAVEVPLLARNRILLDGVTEDGPSSEVLLRVQPVIRPVSQGGPVLSRVESDEHEVRGIVDTDLDCPAGRSLLVDLSLRRESGEVLATQSVTPGPDGAWHLPLPPQCGAARYVVRARLSDSVTQEQGRTLDQSLEVSARPAALGDVEGSLVATCGQGAAGSLTQVLPPGACSVVNLTWAQEDGPPLSEPSVSGATVAVSTRDTELDALVGRDVTLRVTASAEGSTPAVAQHVVSIGVKPFVGLRRQMETPSGAEGGLVGVEVLLSNTTTCGVSMVRYEESLRGAEWVPGSVKVDGVPVAAVATGDGFAVEGLGLRPDGVSRVTYVARSRLLSEARFSGVALLRGVPLTTGQGPRSPPSGCGCSEGGAGAALFGLLALTRVLRRRGAAR
ncbi:hypothetical protein KRR26_19655 [Corallococcus sp. M34]|uniref:hypothetical protein n=1 Tax=Citreicoccus inhibens TaxID=2849499 RepID=UPI001C24381E|nr:hypothetical protein [Citreicoccus inhibens]MBU8897837.1 hypothetical protein [Citreicoccus inhibens]